MEYEYFSQRGMEDKLQEFIRMINNKERGGFNAMLAPRLVAADWEQRCCTLAYYAEPWMSNPAGITHGGILSAAADLTMGMLSIYLAQGNGITPSASISLNYLLPVPLEKDFLVTATADHIGRHLNQFTCSIVSATEPDKPCVTAIGTYYVHKLYKEK